MTSLIEEEPLAGFSPFFWLALCAAAGPLCLVAPWPTCVTGVYAWALYRRSVSVRLLLVGMLVTAVSVVRASERVSQFVEERHRIELVLRPPVKCLLRARVLDSPTVRDDLTRLRVETSEGTCEEKVLPAGTKLRLYGGPPSLVRGDEIEAVAQLGVTRLFRNHELPDPYPLVASSGINGSGAVLSLVVVGSASGVAATIDRARAFVRGRINLTFAPAAAGLAKALVLGENDLTDEEDHSFKVSGLAHLLAVSGTHLIFAVVSVTLAARVVLRRFTRLTRRGDPSRIAYVMGAVLALFYADFAGGSGSAWRAAWMLAAAFGVSAVGRKGRGVECVALSMVVGLVVDPLIALDLSFVLSLAATGGLMTLGRLGMRRLTALRHPGLTKLGESVVATVASTVPCALLLAPLSYEASLVGILANTLAAPFGEAIALPLCLGHTLTAWWPALERGVALVGSGALLVVRQVALVSAKSEGYGVPLPYPDAWQYGAAFGVLSSGYVLWSVPAARRSVAPWLVLAIGIAQWTASECYQRGRGKPHTLRVTFLDVEQGDSALVDFPDGQLMLIDGGGFVGTKVDPGKSVILPVLRRRRRDHLDVMVLSHPHPDHFGGLPSVIQRIQVGAFWDTGQGRAEGAGPVYAQMMLDAEKRAIRVMGPETLCGSRNYGGADLAVLAPCPGHTPNGPANDNSFVLRIAHEGRSVLFVGDAEHAEEEHLVATASDRLASEVLKIGHHGSRTSSTEPFLDLVRPQFAVISCGIRNRYGHPHGVTLERLRKRRVETWRTDVGGSLQWPTAD